MKQRNHVTTQPRPISAQAALTAGEVDRGGSVRLVVCSV